ncbi:MAG: hypothetical protein GY941_05705, partial [Planctomycetes bacterium]|nr:hypothetical protein [Planctomycetota bacterium]
RLEAWGRWQIDNIGIGWPSQSVFIAGDEGNGINTKGSGLKYIPDNPEAEEVDAILADLKISKPIIFKTVVKYYKSQITLYNLSKKTGISRYILRSRLVAGLEFVDKKLNTGRAFTHT